LLEKHCYLLIYADYRPLLPNVQRYRQIRLVLSRKKEVTNRNQRKHDSATKDRGPFGLNMVDWGMLLGGVALIGLLALFL
jgi:hypothetical protein